MNDFIPYIPSIVIGVLIGIDKYKQRKQKDRILAEGKERYYVSNPKPPGEAQACKDHTAKIDKIDEKVDKLGERIAKIEGKLNGR